jgi:hypothetical protein
MPAGHKSYELRGASDFEPREISLKDLRDVGRIAWEKWGHLVADKPIRDLIALAYAEGLYHGAMIGVRDHAALIGSTTGSNPSGASSAAEPASSSATTGIKTPSVKDLLESL